MGLRATVIKKYEIEYGDTQGFNYGASELADLIYEFCEDYGGLKVLVDLFGNLQVWHSFCII